MHGRIKARDERMRQFRAFRIRVVGQFTASKTRRKRWLTNLHPGISAS
jgi:hypothetical protein